jgi:hypothetical protein
MPLDIANDLALPAWAASVFRPIRIEIAQAQVAGIVLPLPECAPAGQRGALTCGLSGD